MSIEETILGSMISNEDYLRAVLPHIKEEYFQNPAEASVFRYIRKHFDTYNKLPSATTLKVSIETDTKNHQKKETEKVINSFDGEVHDTKWLVDITEDFCKEQSIYNAIHESIAILNDESGKKPKSSIPSLLETALATSFEVTLGHDFMEDVEKRWAWYHENNERIPFNIDIWNDITGGGQPKKTLLVLAGAVGFGKSATMCHMAAHNLMSGRNVLYITMEMSELETAQRIDANVLDLDIGQLRKIPRDVYDARMNKARKKVGTGKLIIQEYSPGSAGAGNFRHFIHECKIKKNFTPDVIYVDSVNLIASSRVSRAKHSTKDYLQFCCEELRAIAIDFDLPIVTATQINRKGFEDSNPGMEHTADSWGIPQTADYLWIIIVNDEMLDQNCVMIKQGKNRYGDANDPLKFVVGRDLKKMRYYNASQPDNVDYESPRKKPEDTETKSAAKFAEFTD